MKKTLLILILFVYVSASAQQYRKFLFAIDLGGPNSKSYFPINSFTMEPSYRVNDKVLVGFRIEATGIVSMTGANNSFLGSMGLNAHYYLNQSSARPFLGIGIGLYNPSNNFIMNSTDNLNQRNGLGLYPRAGLEIGHFRVMMEYNFIQTMKDYISYDLPMPGHYENINKSYFSLKVGIFVRGGKKKN
jgi:outer membrane protein X